MNRRGRALVMVGHGARSRTAGLGHEQVMTAGGLVNADGRRRVYGELFKL